MKIVVLLSSVVAVAVASHTPSARGPALPSPDPEMMAAFAPTPEEIQTLNAFHTTPAQGNVPPARDGPLTPPAHPNPKMLAAFVSSPHEFQAPSALHARPATGVFPGERVEPPTMPPAFAKLIAKYKAAYSRATRYA